MTRTPRCLTCYRDKENNMIIVKFMRGQEQESWYFLRLWMRSRLEHTKLADIRLRSCFQLCPFTPLNPLLRESVRRSCSVEPHMTTKVEFSFETLLALGLKLVVLHGSHPPPGRQGFSTECCHGLGDSMSSKTWILRLQGKIHQTRD